MGLTGTKRTLRQKIVILFNLLCHQTQSSWGFKRNIPVGSPLLVFFL